MKRIYTKGYRVAANSFASQCIKLEEHFKETRLTILGVEICQDDTMLAFSVRFNVYEKTLYYELTVYKDSYFYLLLHTAVNEVLTKEHIKYYKEHGKV